jgi:hypothetical protein
MGTNGSDNVLIDQFMMDGFLPTVFAVFHCIPALAIAALKLTSQRSTWDEGDARSPESISYGPCEDSAP